MKRSWGLLAIGFTLGFVVSRLFPGPSAEPPVAPPVEEQSAATAPEAPATETPAPLASQLTPAAASTPDPRAQIPPEIPGTVAGLPHRSPDKIELTIDDDLATQLEANWDDLPNQIHVMREEKGFRVIYIKDGSLFQQTGLQNGDLITRETLEALGGNNSPLAQQMARILGHVSVY